MKLAPKFFSFLLFAAPWAALWLAFSGCAHSHPTQPGAPASPAVDTTFPYPLTQIYLKSGAIDPATVLAPPPAQGSKQDQADYTKLFEYQKTRTSAECARAGSEVIPDLESFYGPKYGPLSAAQVEHWKEFFDGAVRTDSDYYIQAVKQHWNRPRPYIANPAITPCIRKEGANPAYPSGHATFAEVYALILERLVPAKKTEIEARARQIATDRVLGGVHHPTDVSNGRKLGKALFRAFMRSPKFRKALARLQAR